MQGIFLDIESNGLDCYKHRVLEIALKIISLETGQCQASFESAVYVSPQQWTCSDTRSLAINGCSQYSLIEQAPVSSQVGNHIIKLFNDHQVHRDQTLYICQNPSFDRPFFAQLVDAYTQESYEWPYHWLDLASMFWAKHSSQDLQHSIKGLSKDAIANFFKLAPETKPHRAMRGVEHLIECYSILVGWAGSGQMKDNLTRVVTC